MKKLQILLVALCALLFAACTSTPKQDSPTGIVKEYLDLIKAENYEKAVKCFYFKEEKSEIELNGLAQKLKEGYTKDGKLLSYEVVSEEIEKDEAGNPVSAKVAVKLSYDTEKVNDETLNAVYNDGKWKIDYSAK
jgi:hypothetical protein